MGVLYKHSHFSHFRQILHFLPLKIPGGKFSHKFSKKQLTGASQSHDLYLEWVLGAENGFRRLEWLSEAYPSI